MIEYKFPKEKEIALFYAYKLHALSAVSIIENGAVKNSSEATALAKFYWAMVAEAIKEKNNDVDHDFGNMEQWLEYICNTFFFYLSNNGYEEEWDSQ
jgi:hypothetical protein